MNNRDPFPAQPIQSEVDIRQSVRWAWRVVWRGKMLVVACVLLAIVPTVLFLQQVTPLYRASSQIMIEAPETNDVLTDRSASFGRMRITEGVMQTETELISSSMLARRVVDKLHLDQDPEFNAGLRAPKPMDKFLAGLNPLSWIPADWRSHKSDGETLRPTAREDMERNQIVRAFSSRLKVIPSRRSFIITVQFQSESREKAALIANTVAQLYVVDRLEASFEDARRVTDWLGERLDVLRKDVVAAENAAETYRAEHGLRKQSDGQASVTDQQLSEVNSRLVIARADLAQKQARLDQIRSITRSRGSVDATSDVLQSPLIQNLREQEAAKSREISEAMKTYGDRHPRIVGLKADLDVLRGKIAAEVDKVGTSIANDVEVAAAGVRSMEQELAASRQQTDRAGAAEVRLRELVRQADASRSLYEAFLARFKREAEQERMQRANARIVATADIPLGPSYPQTNVALFLAILLSLFGGIALVFLIDYLDNAVRSADESEDLTGLPTLAMIPLHRGRTDRPIEHVLQRPRSALVDSVRSLRTALSYGGGTGQARVTVVTSSIPKEGKTFVSLCLAFLYAKANERVLLIDGDVHRPRLPSALGVDGDRGLAQIVSGEATFEEVVHRGIGDAIDFLATGRSGNAAELIQAQAIETLIATLRGQYSQIIIDSPPTLAVADSRVLARLADQVVYLVKWNSTPRDAVRNGIKLLRTDGVRLTGVVLSQVNQRKHAKYGYGDYGQYYGRYRDYYGK